MSISSNNAINNTAQLNHSNSNDVTVHYIGGYVIRESNQPFVVNENLHQKENNDQIRCVICQKMDYPQRFFDLTKKYCSNLCSLQSNENKIPVRNEPIRVMSNEFEIHPERDLYFHRLLTIQFLKRQSRSMLKNKFHYHLIMDFHLIQVNGR